MIETNNQKYMKISKKLHKQLEQIKKGGLVK